ncbi:MAG: glycosyltransferase [Candidatus Hydrogenedens sp.]|nr:glycosyltransferase [Candidatus Hydrogenedens sp.]
MRILHLFSNHKWTGPAEPALNLCVALQELGLNITFACSRGAGASDHKVARVARERGLPPRLEMHLDKHRHPWCNWQDRRTLRGMLGQRPYDAIHCHLDNDHEIALGPARAAGLPLIRTSYEGLGLAPGRRHEKLLRDTTWLIEPSERAAAHDAQAFPFPHARMTVVPGAVDTERYRPDLNVADMRAAWGMPAEALVFGIVARMQPHRRYEDLFAGFRQVVEAHPSARLVVIGRGTRQEQVGFTPVRELGLEGNVVFSGYLEGDDYRAALAALDAGVYLVPGSDGTCRAARELLAMGKPVLAADRGMLAEIVTDGQSGAVCDGSAEALASVMKAWASEPERLSALSHGAREEAERRFSLRGQAEAVVKVYERVLAEQG